ncbi:MAG: heme exporter protein CcmD [Pseudomonadota bacterium]
MMPDLGDYAGAVLSAYFVTFVLLGGLVGLSLIRARQARDALRRFEQSQGRTDV